MIAVNSISWRAGFEKEIERLNLSHPDAPVALVLTSTHDPDGAALTRPGMEFFFLTLAKTHRVVLKWIERKDQIDPALRETKRMGSIDILVFNAHGSPDSMRMGSDEWTAEDIVPNEFDGIEKEGQIILVSCDTGWGLAERMAQKVHRLVLAPRKSISSEDLSISHHWFRKMEIRIDFSQWFFDDRSSFLKAGYDSDYFQEYQKYLIRRAQAGDGSAEWAFGKLCEKYGKKEWAQKHYQMAAEKGSRMEQSAYGIYLAQHGQEKQGEEWMLKAARQGDVTAQWNVAALLRRRGAIEEGKEWYIQAAEKGNQDAQFAVGICFIESKQYDQAKPWLQKSADRGDTRAMVCLGAISCEQGNLDEGERWFTQAAQLGSTSGAAALGRLYEQRGQDEMAQKWYLEAAQWGDADSRYKMATRYSKDPIEAIQWKRAAAWRGHQRALYDLGEESEKEGRLEEAQECYRNSSLPAAQYQLAKLLEKQGRLQEAQDCYQKAAIQNHPAAQFRLTCLLEKQGRLEEAQAYYRKASDQGFDLADYGLIA
jgi:TPR repeat protein